MEDRESQEIGDILYQAWLVEISEARQAHPKLWYFAWIRAWPDIRSKLSARKEPTKETGSGIWFVLLATVMARPVFLVPVFLVGLLWVKGNRSSR